MDKLRIVDSGVAQLTLREKAAHLGLGAPSHADNQDRYSYDPKRGIFVVADGVGGEPYGDEAAQAVCDTFHDERRAPDRIRPTDETSLLLAQTSLLRVIHAAAQQTGGYSTVTGFYRTKANQIAYIHAGDSSLVLYRQGETHYITSPQHYPHHPNQLMNYVGGEYNAGPHRMAPYAGAQYNSLTEWGTVDVEDGDVCVLTTDGVTSLSGGRELLDIHWQICLQERNRILGAQAIANRLVRISDRPDDATAIVVKFGKTKA